MIIDEDGFTDQFTDQYGNEKLPPFDAPQGVLAWAELPSGTIYLQENYQWFDRDDPGRARILNNCLKVLSPGPWAGSTLGYYCNFVSAFYENKYPVFKRGIVDLGGPDVIY